EGGAGPGGVAIVGVEAEGAVGSERGIEDGLIPCRAARAELLGCVAEYVGCKNGGCKALVAPAVDAVGLGGIEAEGGTGELEVAEVLGGVEENDSGREPPQQPPVPDTHN